jgi:hypothetical protein
MSDDAEREFQEALDRYKRRTGKTVLTEEEVLKILEAMGF